jgi:hypothetical protein
MIIPVTEAALRAKLILQQNRNQRPTARNFAEQLAIFPSALSPMTDSGNQI